MRHEYRDELIEILSQRGRKGLAVSVISLLVFNNHNELFGPEQCYPDLRHRLQRYLWTQSKKRGSVFVHVSHGVYALKRQRPKQLSLPL
ncbi:MAG: hypothetical protein HUK04_07260 [Bacteroidaceae bacterium]|nr:hypothetical protein [Bacteroidaceae bacterium]